MPEPMRRTRVDGWARVAERDGVEVWRGPGRGPAIVAAHGIQDTWAGFREVGALLPEHTLYSLTLPWRGGADGGWARSGTAAQWLRRALELVPEKPVALVGHSFGANAILAHLASAPPEEHPEAVVLAAPFYRPADYRLTRQLARRARAAFRKTIGDGLLLSLGRRAATLPPGIVGDMRAKLLDRVVGGNFPVFYAEFAASGTLDLSRITVPTLILAGGEDEGMTRGRAAALARDMPAATLRLRPSYGHFSHLAHPDRLSRDIGGWVATAEIPSPRGGPAVTTLLDGEPTSYTGRPRYEGANIRTWIGFKHFMYLAEEAILEYFRERHVGARELYLRHGLGLEIVDSSVQLPMTLELDEQVHVTVVSGQARPDQGAPFTVEMTVERDGADVTVLTGRVRVALVPVKESIATEPVPSFLAPYVVPEVAALRDQEAATLQIPEGATVEDVLGGPNAYLWSWRAPYTYCHFSDRLQHSAYVRTLEEVVDRFLHDRGLAIGDLLVERSWIPVVSRARVRMLSDVWMEETVHTVFTVEEVLKDRAYTARMDCYVRRGDEVVRTATATIMHGYAVSAGPDAGTLAVLDPATQAILLGRAS